MIEKHALLTDVYHLRAESEKMRYTDDDMKRTTQQGNNTILTWQVAATTIKPSVALAC